MLLLYIREVKVTKVMFLERFIYVCNKCYLLLCYILLLFLRFGVLLSLFWDLFILYLSYLILRIEWFIFVFVHVSRSDHN